MDAIIRTPEISAIKRRLGRLPESAPMVVQALSATSPVEEGHLAETEFETLMHAQELAAEVDARSQYELRLEQEVAELRAQAERRGYAEGQEKAAEAARKAVSEQLERFNSIVASLYQSRRSVLDGAEESMVEMAYAAVCRIVGQTATTREAIAAMIEQTVGSLQKNDELVVRLHPQDLLLIQTVKHRPHRDEISEAGAGGEVLVPWQLRADSSIEIGGCIVEAGSGTLDARLEVQLSKLRETLVTIRQNRENPEEVV